MENSQWVVLGIGAVAVVVGLILALLGMRGRKKLQSIQDTPTVSAGDAARMALAAMGSRVEIVGRVEAEEPLLSPASHIPCVYYDYKLEHRRERREQDSQGNWRTEEHWDTVEDRKEHVPFRICDASGECHIFPEGADFVAETRTHQGYGRGYEEMKSTGSVAGDVLDSVLDVVTGALDDVTGYRYTESVIRVGQPVYVLGNTQRSGEIASVGKGDGPFIISYKMEQELTRKYKISSVLQYVFAAILATGGVVGIIYALAFMAK
jgi:hypothetical protein